MGYSYNPKSLCADEFINDEEILETLAFADAHKDDVQLCYDILEKCKPHLHPASEHGAMITHREASVLLACEDAGVNAAIKQLAHDIKQAYYGNRIVLFAPLYLSIYCVYSCLYWPYHAKNREIPRRKLTQDEIRAEVIALQDMGHKRLAIEAGEDPKHNPIEYILESMDTIYSIITIQFKSAPLYNQRQSIQRILSAQAPLIDPNTAYLTHCCIRIYSR